MAVHGDAGDSPEFHHGAFHGDSEMFSYPAIRGVAQFQGRLNVSFTQPFRQFAADAPDILGVQPGEHFRRFCNWQNLDSQFVALGKVIGSLGKRLRGTDTHGHGNSRPLFDRCLDLPGDFFEIITRGILKPEKGLVDAVWFHVRGPLIVPGRQLRQSRVIAGFTFDCSRSKSISSSKKAWESRPCVAAIIIGVAIFRC